MTIGSIDNCLTGDPLNNAQHFHTAQLVIQNVEDLVGWQARMNYDGARMRPSTVNFTPFTDNTTGQNVSFLNLPFEGGVHREVVTATTIPPQAASLQTALVGAVYNGAQNAAVSPDTPAKSPPDDSTYSAPAGGVLAVVNLQVLAGQAAMPSLYIDLDDGDPNGPGSDLVIFTGSGTVSSSLAEADLVDGFHGERVPCLPVGPPPAVAVPPPPMPAPPAAAGADDAEPGSGDSDYDGFSDTIEPLALTDPMRPCGIDAWPPDTDNNGWVDTYDFAQVTNRFGLSVPPGPARYDFHPDPPNGFIDTGEISRITGVFGTTCNSPASIFGPTPCNIHDRTNHWWAGASSGTGNTNEGTKLWTYTPLQHPVDRDRNGTWAESAWLMNDDPRYPSNDFEVGFYSGWFPYENTWRGDGMLGYHVLNSGAGPAARFEQPNWVPRGSWVTIEAVSNGPAKVWVWSWYPNYYVGKPAKNWAQGEVTYEFPVDAPQVQVDKTRTWMSGGAGEGFSGYWTDSTDPNAHSPQKWYVWGIHPRTYCMDAPYWIRHYRDNQWSHGGYGE